MFLAKRRPLCVTLWPFTKQNIFNPHPPTHTERKKDSSAAEGRKCYSEQMRLCECCRGTFPYRAMWVPAGQCSEKGEGGSRGSLQTVHKETLPPSCSHANESHFVWGLKNSQGSEQRRFKPTIEPQFSREKPTMLSLSVSLALIKRSVWMCGCQGALGTDRVWCTEIIIHSHTHTFPETGIDQLSWKAGTPFLTFSECFLVKLLRMVFKWGKMELVHSYWYLNNA